MTTDHRTTPRTRRGMTNTATMVWVTVVALVVMAVLISIELPGTVAAQDVPDPPTQDMQARVAEAITAQRERVLTDAGNHEMWGAYGAVLDAHERHEDAEFCYRRALDLSGGDFRWGYLLGTVMELNGRPPLVILQFWEKCAQQEPTYAALHHRMGDMLVRTGEVEAAEAAYRRAIDADAELAIARRGLGQVLLRARNYEAARLELEQALEAGPGDRATLTALAQCYSGLGDTQHAEAAAARVQAIEADINQAGVGILRVRDPLRFDVEQSGVGPQQCDERAARLFAEGNAEGAAENLRIVLESRPDDATIHLRLGTALASMGRLREAAAALERSIELDDSVAATHLMLGGVWEIAEMPDQAEPSLRRATALDPDNAGAWRRLGRARAALEDDRGAIDAYMQAVGLGYPGTDVHAELALLLERIEMRHEAIASWQRVLVLEPAHVDALDAASRLGFTPAGPGAGPQSGTAAVPGG